MNSRLTHFLKSNWLLVTAFATALTIALWFGVQLALDFLYFSDPRNVDVELRGWMTPRYIVLTYDLPRDVVRDILELSSEDQAGQRLRFVAENLDLSLDELTERVRAAAADYRATTQ